MKTLTGTAPSAWACYLINGEDCGMTGKELRAADKFAEWLGGNIVDCQDVGFIVYHDARQFLPLAADCMIYTAIIQESME